MLNDKIKKKTNQSKKNKKTKRAKRRRRMSIKYVKRKKWRGEIEKENKLKNLS